MDSWLSDWGQGGPNDNENVLNNFENATSSHSHELNSMDSPNISKDDSTESCAGEQAWKSDCNVTKKATFKTILQAKKRLQAFSATKQLKKSSKDEKTEDLDKADKTLPKKSKKAMYPLDKAQAVVQEIEKIKQKEAQQEQKFDAIMAGAYKTLSMKEVLRVRSRSPSSEREQQFKKREIKCRNYRRSDSFKRRSASPESHGKRSGKVYPRNWTEYREQGLTFVKDEELRSKIFPKIKYNTHELVAKLLTFDGPSAPLDSFKIVTVEDKTENIPVPLLRITRSKPTVTYSVNSKKNKESFVTRKQLFQIISRDRRNAIEKLINSASSRSTCENGTFTSRPWYAKSWKRSTDAECRILENSVGLSFLQTYSDEEEEYEETVNEEDVKPKETIPEETDFFSKCPVPDKNETEWLERGTLTPEERPDMIKIKEKEEAKAKTKRLSEKEETKEIVLDDVKKKEEEELCETRKVIRELEEELERRKAIRREEAEETRKKTKKKRSKKKETSSESEEEEEEEEEKYAKKKKKKKKRANSGKKKYAVEDDATSSDNEKPKKYKKKSKRKKEKITKKKGKSKESSSAKERKSQRTEEDDDGDDQKKKKKGEIGVVCEIADIEETVKVKKGASEKIEKIKETSIEERLETGVKVKNDEAGKRKTKDGRGDSPLLNDYRPSENVPLLIDVEEKKTKPDDAKVEWHNPEHADARKSTEKDVWSDRKQNRSRRDSDFSPKSDDGTRKRRDSEMNDDRKTGEKPKDKHRSRDELKHKTETEHQERRYGKLPAKKYNSDRNRGTGDGTEKKSASNERHSVKNDKQMENKYKPQPLAVKTEPDWDNLRTKRTRYKHGDSKANFADEFEGFPLEEDLFFHEAKRERRRRSREGRRKETGTPDTEEYRENWEKDPYPIWESEDEAPVKAREKMNSSWESDEEIFERGHPAVVENARPLHDTLDLEIPLNIKPFKRREIVDPDAELQLLKRQSLSLNEERRKLEIEKLRVKELELIVIKEAESHANDEKPSKRRRSNEKDIAVNDYLESEATIRKRGRWDRKISSPKTSDVILGPIKKETMEDEDSSTNVSSTTSVNTSAVLENEYEEFMRALTSSPKKTQTKNRSKKDTPRRNETGVTNDPVIVIEDDSPRPVPQITTILPKDVSLIPIPLPAAEIKPVPVPSPRIEIDTVPKPLINLNLSASITLDITPNFASPADVDTKAPEVAVTQSFVTSEKEGDLMNFASPLTDTSLDSFKEKGNEREEKKPFVFTTMVLPSKRQLLNNSNLNLGDSDDDEKHAKPLQKLDDVARETKTEIADDAPPEKDKPEAEKVEPEAEKVKEVDGDAKKCEKKDTAHPRTPQDKESRRRRSPDRYARRDSSPRRFSHGKREFSPRRRSRESPRRSRGQRHSPRRRSPVRRRSPGKRRHSPRSRRRSSISPPRRKSSPRRSPSPPKPRSGSPKRVKSKSPDRRSSSYKPALSSDRPSANSNKPKSPVPITSPLEGLKRSVADSTISDDLLPQPAVNVEEYVQTPTTQFYDRTVKIPDSPKRESLDTRINQVLGLTKEEPRPIPTTYSNYNAYSQFPRQFDKTGLEFKGNGPAPVQQAFAKTGVSQQQQQSKSNFVQVGNMVRILPTENLPVFRAEKSPVRHVAPVAPVPSPASTRPAPPKSETSQIVQVGNMLQIVPADLLPAPPPLPPEPKQPPSLPSPPAVVHEKQSAESSMRLKVAERREEREKRRQERERRRKEKEKRRKEKEKQRQIRLRQRTEDRIKKALELEVENADEEPEPIPTDLPAQWPPLPVTVSSVLPREAGKSILVRTTVRADSQQQRKAVQFADGVRPGEGTSPSGGEELSSPPPRRRMPKEKRYKKTKLQTKNQKKKVKVKIIKKRPETEESDEDDTLPPPSPPPGSPPPHIFPPRMKPPPPPQPAISTIQPYLPNVLSIHAGHQQLFRPPPQLNLIMHPHHGPPPPPHHHGPPPPPPHHHHPHHHGPPLPPGPPHFHHGPPPPPPHHHGPPPPPPGPHHHHRHGPPPPFHR